MRSCCPLTFNVICYSIWSILVGKYGTSCCFMINFNNISGQIDYMNEYEGAANHGHCNTWTGHMPKTEKFSASCSTRYHWGGCIIFGRTDYLFQNQHVKEKCCPSTRRIFRSNILVESFESESRDQQDVYYFHGEIIEFFSFICVLCHGRLTFYRVRTVVWVFSLLHKSTWL